MLMKLIAGDNILELEDREEGQNNHLPKTWNSKQSEIDAKNIHIRFLLSNIETLKEQLCLSTEQRKELESEKAKVASLEKEVEYIHQIKKKLSDLIETFEAKEMAHEVSFIKPFEKTIYDSGSYTFMVVRPLRKPSR